MSPDILTIMGSSDSGSSRDFLWISLVLFIILCIAFLLPLQPHDYWFYVRVGQDTMQNGAVPRVDMISWSQFGSPIYYQPWLSAVLFWLIYKVGGLPLTFILRGLLIGITYGLVWKMMRKRGVGAIFASSLTLLLALATSNNWSMRPQLFAYPLFVFTLFILFRWQDGKNKTLWTLPLISLLWVNLHGSFILLFVLAGTALLFGKGDKKNLFIWMGASTLMTLINPQHIRVWGYVGTMLQSPSDQLFSVEWHPPQNIGWQMNIFFAWLLLFAPLVAISNKRLPLFEWIWILLFGWMALSGVRYIIWFLIILSVSTAHLLSSVHTLVDESKADTKLVLNYILGCIFLLSSLSLLPTFREKWWFSAPSPYALANTPVDAVEWLSSHPDIPGPLWNDYAFGSYLAFALPSFRPWMDSRFNAYTPQQWEEYRALANATVDWESFFDRKSINLLMLSIAGEPELIKAVANNSSWCKLYQDQYAVIFGRRGASEFCP